MASTPQPIDTNVRDDESLLPPIQELTEEEWYEMWDYQARRRLGISGEEFQRRYHARDFRDGHQRYRDPRDADDR